MLEDKYYNSWLAGFWEGEGCLSKLKRQTGYYISIVQAINGDRNVEFCIKKIQERFRGCINIKKSTQCFSSLSKPQIVWRLNKRKDIIYFLETIYPYCQLRKKDIENALKHYETHPKRINQYKKCGA